MLVEDVLKQFNIKYKINSEELKNLDFCGWDDGEIKSAVEKILVENNVNLNKKFIVINPVSSRETKNLTIEQYKLFINILKQQFKEYEIILVGGQNDLSFVGRILGTVNTKSLVGKLSLKQLAYLLSKTKVFISPDTGPAFIAQAVRCKTVIFFTSTSPDKYAPYSENVKNYYSQVICAPCYKDFCPEKIKNKCISEVDIEKIVDLVKGIL